MKEHRKHLNVHVHNIAVQPNMFDNKSFKYQYCWYGVEYDTGVLNSAITRIGNMDMHKYLPIQSKMRRCLLADDGTVNYYTNHADSKYKENGIDLAILDGTDGQFMVEIAGHYVRFEIIGTKRRIKLSPLPLAGFTYIPKCYAGAVHATLNRSNNKLSAVVNKTTTYRGGDNKTTYDVTASSESGSFSLLGKPATSISLTNFRTYARNRGSRWNCYDYNIYQVIYYLYLVEYAERNCHLTMNYNLNAQGFRQGGLGPGVTTLDGTKLNNLSGYQPFVDCGFTTSLGNNTGQLTFTMPFSYDSSGKANYGGDYNASVECVANKYYSLGENLYKCTQTCTGIHPTNTSYFTKVTRTTCLVNSYRGIENPFGHIWNWMDGILVNIQASGNSLVYVCEKRSSFASTLNNDYILVGNEARTSNYVKNIIFPNLVASEVGGTGVGSTTGFCDYHYTSIPASGSSVRGVLFGGYAYNGANAGFVYSNSNIAPSITLANIGSRLCFF